MSLDLPTPASPTIVITEPLPSVGGADTTWTSSSARPIIGAAVSRGSCRRFPFSRQARTGSAFPFNVSSPTGSNSKSSSVSRTVSSLT